MAEHTDVGQLGEELAKDYMVKQGFEVEQQNWHWHHKEIDLIVSSHDLIVFVEVKTRTAGGISKPEDALNRKKQNFLIQAADAYLVQKDIEKEARFDVISIYIDGKEHKLKHIPEAFGPRW